MVWAKRNQVIDMIRPVLLFWDDVVAFNYNIKSADAASKVIPYLGCVYSERFSRARLPAYLSAPAFSSALHRAVDVVIFTSRWSGKKRLSAYPALLFNACVVRIKRSNKSSPMVVSAICRAKFPVRKAWHYFYDYSAMATSKFGFWLSISFVVSSYKHISRFCLGPTSAFAGVCHS